MILRISIVTLSFNQGDFLRHCIESVLSQEEVDLDYIIVDPGSKDKSRSIINEYKNDLTRVYQQDDGPSAGLNNGFAVATGSIYGFLNADDYLLPGALRSIEKHYTQTDCKHFVSGGGYLYSPKGVFREVKPTTMTINNVLWRACTIFQQGTFFPSYMFHNVGGFNNKNHSCWDFELYTKFLQLGYRHSVINEKLAVFTVHPDSLTGSGRNTTPALRDQARLFREITGREWQTVDTVRSLMLRSIKKSRQLFFNY